MAEKIIIIGNPIAGGGAESKIKKASDLLARMGIDSSLMLTCKKGDAEDFARSIRSRPVRLVISAGGDGTYNEVANGLVHSEIPMAILPLGTTSVLAQELNIPNEVKKALDVALHGTVRTVHLGKISFGSDISSRHTLQSATRYFLLMAGVGFDAEATRRINKKIKRITGQGAYFWSGLETLLSYNPRPFTLAFREDIDDAVPPRNLTGYAAIIGKASCYGGTYKATPDARLTDPCFYVFVTHSKNRRSLLRYIAGIISGKHTSFGDISYFKAEEIAVSGEAPVQIDGDYEGNTPVRIAIERNALKLVTPN